MKNQKHITQERGLGFISPRPRARLDTTITALLEATQNNSTNSSTPVQISLTTGYIIYIMENNNLLNSLTHSK